MTDLSALLAQGNAWLFIPSAIGLGALHGLEPGHSKTMMAAFIIAVRGTLTQAVLLGLSATLSHTAVVWVVALAGVYFGQHWDATTAEPVFQLASAAIIIAVALWMLWRTWHRHGHDHGHTHEPAHDHAHGQNHVHRHEFEGDHQHDHDHRHPHDHGHSPHHGASTSPVHAPAHHSQPGQTHPAHASQRVAAPADEDALRTMMTGEEDAHARAHARDIRRRFANRQVTTGQIILFGLTGGLVPCPAAITVLLLCLQLKHFALGATLVAGFSVGLALTMVSCGVLAALGARHVSRHWPGWGRMADRAPYLSGALMTLVGLYMGYQGLVALG